MDGCGVGVGGEGAPGEGFAVRGAGPVVDGAVGGAHGFCPAGLGFGGGAGAEGEGGGLFAGDDEPGGGGVGAEVGEVVLGDGGGDVAGEGVGVLGGHGEPHLGAGVGRDRLAQLSGELAQVLMGEDHGKPVAAGFGEHLVEAAREVEEVLGFVDHQARVDPGRLAEPGPVGGGLPHLGDDEGAEQAGGLLTQDALGGPHQAHPAVQYLAHVEAPVGAADDLADEVTQQERPQLVHDRPDHLGPVGLRHLLVGGPEPAEADHIGGHRLDARRAERFVGEQPGDIREAGGGAGRLGVAQQGEARRAQHVVGARPPEGGEDGAEDPDQVVDDEIGVRSR